MPFPYSFHPRSLFWCPSATGSLGSDSLSVLFSSLFFSSLCWSILGSPENYEAFSFSCTSTSPYYLIFSFSYLSPPLSFSKFSKEYSTLPAPGSYNLFSNSILIESFLTCYSRIQLCLGELFFLRNYKHWLLLSFCFTSLGIPSGISTLLHHLLAQRIYVTPKVQPLTPLLSPFSHRLLYPPRLLWRGWTSS